MENEISPSPSSSFSLSLSLPSSRSRYHYVRVINLQQTHISVSKHEKFTREIVFDIEFRANDQFTLKFHG